MTASLACSIRLVRMRTSTHVLGLLLAVLSLSLASHPEPSQTKDERAGSKFPIFIDLDFIFNFFIRGLLSLLHRPVPQPAVHRVELLLHLRDLLHQLGMYR